MKARGRRRQARVEAVKIHSACTYSRFSEDRQEEGDSLRRQKEWQDKTCQQNGWSIKLRFEDKGESGYHGDNLDAQLGKLLELIEKGVIGPGWVLVVEDMDRLSRMETEAHRLVKWMAKVKGVCVQTKRSLTSPENVGEMGTDLPNYISSWLGHQESQKKSERITAIWDAWYAAIADGKKVPPPGVMPPWLKRTEDKKGFVVKEEAANAVRLIYQLAAENKWGARKICAELNERGVPTIGGTKRSGRWCNSYIGKLLSTEMVIGTFVDPMGKEHKDLYPAIVDKDLFATLRIALAGRARGQKGVGRPAKDGWINLFAGLVRDSRDGQMMHVHTKGGRTLFSANAGKKCGKVKYKGIPMVVLEDCLLGLVGELKLEDLTENKEGVNGLAVLEGRRKALEKRIAVAKKMLDSDDFESILTQMGEWERELKAVVAEIGVESARVANCSEGALGEAKEIARQLGAGGDAALRQRAKDAFRGLVREIAVYVWDVKQPVRAALVQVVFGSGGVRELLLTWRGAGERLQVMGVSHLLGGQVVWGVDTIARLSETLVGVWKGLDEAVAKADAERDEALGRVGQ